MTSSDRNGLIIAVIVLLMLTLPLWFLVPGCFDRVHGPCETKWGIFPDCGRL